MMILVVVQISVSMMIRWLHELAAADIENTFKSRLMSKILHKEYASVIAIHTAEWLNRLTSDTKVVAEGYVEILPGLSETVVRLFSALVMIVVLDKWFAYHKEPLCNFEMHRGLFGSSHDKKFYEYYAGVKSRLIKDDGNSYGYHFSPEDLYVYITAHEYKHYSGGGTGLRSLLDVYMFLKKFEGKLDLDHVLSEAEKLGLSEFEEKNRGLALNLFGNQELRNGNREMLKYIVNSGAYGNIENSVRNRLKKYGGGRRGKIKYMLKKVFPPVDGMKSTYPRLCEHKIYYPAMIIFRLMKAVMLKRRKVLRELLILWKVKV